MVLLKAQGRFRLILYWQLAHVVIGASLITALAKLDLDFVAIVPRILGLPANSETNVPLVASLVGAFLWGIGCPFALYAAGRPAGASWRSVVIAIAQPWPAALAGGLFVGWMPRVLLPFLGETYANVATITLAVPISIVAVTLAAASDSDGRHELRRIFYAAMYRLRLPKI
jgi:hypothetical protein